MTTETSGGGARDLALNGHAWPFEEARKVLARIERRAKAGKPLNKVLFETGYGPSGLPHIGTFGEVARTSWVRHAFETMSGIPTHLIAFSDDMDGLRKVPDNLPNQEMLRAHLGKPLTAVPDPFGTHESFGAHNNARLQAFLNRFGFRYEFMSSTDCYKSGRFDAALLTLLQHFETVRDVVLPTLGAERSATYSPFLPISPKTGNVLQVPVLEWNAKAGTIVFEDEDGTKTEIPVTGGHVKCQWKADWAMRWLALGVDYEMSGKDLIPSVELSSKILRAIGGEPPEGFNYELFLDDKGQKISKSKGNGLSVDEWLTYGPEESIALFMYQKPRVAKKLYFDVIPKAVDDYITFLDAYPGEEDAKKLENPVWHLHGGKPPREIYPVTFALLLNLVSASNASSREVLWGFIKAYAPEASPEANPGIDKLVSYAVKYYEDFVRPAKKYRAPSEKEHKALAELAQTLEGLSQERDGAVVQNAVYEIGKAHGFEPLRDWFKALYEVLFGQTQGPRFGSFAALYGCKETAELIRHALAGGLMEEAR
ncbi:MAG TPA: lysine--tRNA ligase [Rhizomicrobium sp.]|jgi:lysyl-tRNA synthetase class 1